MSVDRYIHDGIDNITKINGLLLNNGDFKYHGYFFCSMAFKGCHFDTEAEAMMDLINIIGIDISELKNRQRKVTKKYGAR